MKKHLYTSLAFVLGFVLALGLAFTVVNRMPTPAAFVDQSGTNGVIIGDTNMVQVFSGTNNYIGFTVTTNMLSGGGKTNTLIFNNGILTGIGNVQ